LPSHPASSVHAHEPRRLRHTTQGRKNGYTNTQEVLKNLTANGRHVGIATS
jgi:hypothetical protein